MQLERVKATVIVVGDMIHSNYRVWRVTEISDPIPHDFHGMFVMEVEPADGGAPRHKGLHTYPFSEWKREPR